MVEEGTGVIRMVVSPSVTWDFETPPNSYSLTVRGTDFPGGTPRLSVSTMSQVQMHTAHAGRVGRRKLSLQKFPWRLQDSLREWYKKLAH